MFQTSFSSHARLASLLIALAALTAQAVQTSVDMAAGMSLIEALWHQARYFTNIMTWIVMLVFALQTLRNRAMGQSLLAAITLWDAFVGVVYHALLATTHHPKGWDVLVNELHHTWVPIAVALYWITFAPKASLSYRAPFVWLTFPNAYAIYGIFRGLADGAFPYFFLNPNEGLGWGGVFAFIAGLNFAFLLAGLLLTFLARRFGQASVAT